MSFLSPHSLPLPLAPLDHYFLQTSLTNLGAHNCVIPFARREACRVALEGALQGEVPVVDAAAALMKGHEDNNIRRLDGGLLDPDGRPIHLIEKVTRFPLREIYQRFGEPHRVIQDFMSGNPAAGDWEMTEVTFIRNFDPTAPKDFITVRRNKVETAVQVVPYDMTHLGELERFEFFRSLIHPPGSRIWRHPPFQLILGAIQLMCGENSVGIQFTPYLSSEEEYRALWLEDKRPLCVGSKPSPTGPDFPTEEGDLAHPGLFRIGGEKGVFKTGLYVAYHDAWHILDWGLTPPEARKMQFTVADCLKRVSDSLPSHLQRHPVFDRLMGEALHFYMTKDFLFGYIDRGFSQHETTGELPAGLMDRFRVEFQIAHGE
jgi:hypothetical protein